jgi:hypothetical protein
MHTALPILQAALGVLLAELALAILRRFAYAFRRPVRLPWRRWPGRRSFRRSAY